MDPEKRPFKVDGMFCPIRSQDSIDAQEADEQRRALPWKIGNSDTRRIEMTSDQRVDAQMHQTLMIREMRKALKKRYARREWLERQLFTLAILASVLVGLSLGFRL